MRKQLFFFILCSFRFFSCYAQSGVLDPTFQVGTGIGLGSYVQTVSIQSDGKIFVGGDFRTYNDSIANYMVRLNTDGSTDTTFKPGAGVNYIVLCSAIQTDGRIILGGEFFLYNGIARNSIVRINTDGSLDTTFNPGAGANNNVRAIAIQSDGKIIIGGIFTTYNGYTENNIARLNTDGSLDTTFNTGTGANGSVQAIAIQPDGEIVIGGDFTEYNSSLIFRVARINTDGSIDAGFTAILGADKVVYSIAIQSLGHIVIGGNFSNFDSQARGKVARLDANSTLDVLFTTNPGAGQQVDVVLIQPNGQILIAGSFTSYNDTTRAYIALLDDTGHLNPSFNPQTGPNAEVICAALQPDGKIIIGGLFTTCDGISRNGIARLDACTLPQPGPISGDSTTLCGGTSTYSISPVTGADNYTWTLPLGWTGSSDSASIIATSNGNGGNISVTANSSLCGASAAQTDSITQIQPPGTPICLCTVDTQSTHNIVVWDNPQSNLIDTFFIYREITTNTYAKIGAVASDSLSEYNDYGANPNTTSFTYKLSTLDNCGVESALSLYHSTINLQNLGSGNFQWTFYEIENSQNPVISFNVYRDDLGNGNFSQIGLVPGTNATFTDITYSSFPNSIYVVDVQWDISCNPTRAISTTRSNIRPGAKALNGIDENLLADNLEIYPNPAAKVVNLLLPSSPVVTGLKLVNALGQVVWGETEPGTGSGGLKQIDIENFSSGLYTLTIETNEGMMNRKLIIR